MPSMTRRRPGVEGHGPGAPGRAVVVDGVDRQAAQLGGERRRVPDGGRGEAEGRLGAVVEADPPQAAQQMGDMAAEDPPQGVQLVDDDIAQAHEERRPAVVVGEDPGVEHLRVRQHHVGGAAQGGPFLVGSVAVVGDGPHARHEPRPQGPELVVGQRLGREEQQSGALVAGQHRLGDRHLVAERLARPGAGGQGDAAAGPEAVDRLRLVGVEPLRAPGGQALDDLGMEGPFRLGVAGRSGRRDVEARQAGPDERVGGELVEGLDGVHGPSEGTGVL